MVQSTRLNQRQSVGGILLKISDKDRFILFWVIVVLILSVILICYAPEVFATLFAGGMGYLICYSHYKNKLDESNYSLYVTNELVSFIYKMTDSDKKLSEDEFKKVVREDKYLSKSYEEGGIPSVLYELIDFIKDNKLKILSFERYKDDISRWRTLDD
jgi:hypothetical protein